MGLITLVDLKARLGITGTGDDDFLNIQIEYVSDVIEGYCGRKFSQASYTQTYYSDDMLDRGRSLESIFSFHYPIISITSFKEDGEDLSGYRTHVETGKFNKVESGYKESWFSDGSKEIEIVYEAGYAVIPTIITETLVAIIGERYNKHSSGVALDFGSDVQRVSIPGTISIDFDYTLENNSRSRRFGAVIGNHANMLDPFRSERVILGAIRTNYVS